MDDDDGGNTVNPSIQPLETPPAAPEKPVDDSTGALECRLIARLAARDSAAMVEFYQALANPLYSYALRTLGNEGDAEEALQDTLVRVWDRAATFDATKSKPFTWCLMILRGLCMDRLRRRSALKRRAVTVPLDSVPDPPSTGSDVVRTLIVHERLRHVQDAMTLLHPLERRYIELSVFGEITHSEIAGQVDEPLGTVKTRIRRGLVKLRSILARTNDDD